MQVAIIGGGASGIMCAAALKKKNKNIDVTVYEKLPRVLKKILATGNGRCNITNAYSSAEYFCGDTRYVNSVFEKYSPQSNMRFFEEIGLLLREESQGRVYPVSNQASSVVNALLGEIKNNGVKVVTDTEITEIKPIKNGFLLNSKIKADKVVISAGGSAAKQQGTDGGAFRLLKSLSLEIETPAPALTGVLIDGFPKSLKGIRNICEVSLFIGSDKVYSEKGEIQFNDYGLSGIPVMQLSGFVSQSKNKNMHLTLDVLPDTQEKRLCGFLLEMKKKYPEKTAEEMMTGFVSKALGNYLLMCCKVGKDDLLVQVSEKSIKSLASLIKNLNLKVKGTRGFDFAQVTAGGLRMSEIDCETMRCKKYKNLYVTGEALNVYGLCGGHNLQWAWSTGRICADAISKESTDC